MSSVACNWAFSDSSMRSAPKIVQISTIGGISSTRLHGNSLNCAFYDGLRLAFLINTKEGAMGDVVVTHPLDPEDAPAIAGIRTATRAQKGAPWRIEAR